MPISLIPSRRRFLAASLAAGAGLLLNGRRAFAAPEFDPDRIALLSDIHINADPAKTDRGINMAEHLQKAVGEILELQKGSRLPAAAIVNGDCATLLGLLRPLADAGLPIHCGMGNHDDREQFRKTIPYEKFAPGAADESVNPRHLLTLRTPKADWVILDSLDKTNSTPGVVGEAQLAWLKATLDARRDRNVLVMVHHDPHLPAPATQPTTKPIKISGITDTPALMDVLLPRRQVKALFFGHTHVWSQKQIDGLHLVNLPAVAYVFGKQPSAWTDCRLSAGGATLELHCIDPKHAKQGEHVELKWR
jgi:3',5'-cyclic-AMP phosphodiesterase